MRATYPSHLLQIYSSNSLRSLLASPTLDLNSFLRNLFATPTSNVLLSEWVNNKLTPCKFVTSKELLIAQQPGETDPHPHTVSFLFCSQYTPTSPMCSRPFKSRNWNCVCPHLFLATCLTRYLFLALIILMIFTEEYKLWNFLLYNFLQNIFLNSHSYVLYSLFLFVPCKCKWLRTVHVERFCCY